MILHLFCMFWKTITLHSKSDLEFFNKQATQPVSLYLLQILSIISQKSFYTLSKTLYNPSRSSLHILSFNLYLYSHSIIKIILTHNHLGRNFTFILVFSGKWLLNLLMNSFFVKILYDLPILSFRKKGFKSIKFQSGSREL